MDPRSIVIRNEIDPSTVVYERYIECAKDHDKNFLNIWDKGLDALLVFVSLLPVAISHSIPY